jgi:HEAT repeat protein
MAIAIFEKPRPVTTHVAMLSGTTPSPRRFLKVACRKSRAVAIWILTAAILPFHLARAQAPPPASQPSGAASALAIVQDPDASKEARELAAQRLVASHSDDIRPVLLKFLVNDHGSQLAVAQALGSVSWPDPAFVQPLESLLGNHDATLAGAAATALAQYSTNSDVLQHLVAAARAAASDDARVPIIHAIAAFDQKPASAALIDLLHGDARTAAAAADALVDMTGLDDLGHDVRRWEQWWDQNGNRPETEFEADIRVQRAAAFERRVARQNHADDVVARLLNDLYVAAKPEQRQEMLIRYLRSPDPKIRVLGANLLRDSRDEPGRAWPAAMKEARGMLGDVSPDVRAAAAYALDNDADSAADMIAQLAVEPQDSVRLALIHSLAPLHDPAAITLMVKCVESDPSLAVRAEAADGIRQGADIVIKDPQLRQHAITALRALLESSQTPGTQDARMNAAAALGALRDQSLLGLFLNLVGPREPVRVRAVALRALADLPDPSQVIQTIASFLSDDEPEIRLAAVEAMGELPQPRPDYMSNLVERMNDPRPDIRAAAWTALQKWLTEPLAESDLKILADELRADPAKQLLVLQTLADRLGKDVANASSDQQRQDAAGHLAEQQQNIGDLKMSLNLPSEAADQYQAALRFWQTNPDTSPEVIQQLCRDVVTAQLEAKKWTDAATFASTATKQYSVQMPPIMEMVGAPFKLKADQLLESGAPGAYDDAMGFFAAVDKMDPPLQSIYKDQVQSDRAAIEAKHIQQATSRP